MLQTPLRLRNLITHGYLQRGRFAPSAPAEWSLTELSGRLVELSGMGARASLTLAFGLVLDAQWQGEPVAWVTPGQHTFYPPDAAEGGVDLDALLVVRVPAARAVARAADQLVRSGAFGLIVLDLGANAALPTPLQMRLVGLAQRHHTALLCLTENETTSLGPLVSLRGHAQRRKIAEDRFMCALRILKDKRRGPTWTHVEVCRGPAGLR
ncbi:MAG: recombinase A [Candidatus Methylomirabilia bacterium]